LPTSALIGAPNGALLRSSASTIKGADAFDQAENGDFNTRLSSEAVSFIKVQKKMVDILDRWLGEV